jgi:hypothetical protein
MAGQFRLRPIDGLANGRRQSTASVGLTGLDASTLSPQGLVDREKHQDEDFPSGISSFISTFKEQIDGKKKDKDGSTQAAHG